MIKKQTHLIQNKWNRTLAHTIVRQNARKAMMRRRAALSVMKIHVSARRQRIRQHSLPLQKKHTKKKLKTPTLGWKKFVRKVRNAVQFFCTSVLKTYTGQLEGVGRLQPFSSCAHFSCGEISKIKKPNFLNIKRGVA